MNLYSHEGPVWQVQWAHPKFGNILASCSYDSKVFIWKELHGQWKKIKEHAIHTASVNSISWAPHTYGLILTAASSDGKVSVLTYKGTLFLKRRWKLGLDNLECTFGWSKFCFLGSF